MKIDQDTFVPMLITTALCIVFAVFGLNAIYEHSWFCTDSCMIQIKVTHHDTGRVDYVDGVLKIYTNRFNHNAHQAAYYSIIADYREVDFDYALNMFRDIAHREPNLVIK